MISPISFSLTISGGVSSIVSPAGRIMIPALKNACSSARIDAFAGAAGNRRKIDRAGETNAADVDDVGQALEPHDGVIPLGFDRLGALEQALVTIEVDRGQGRGAGERMARIGIAVEELDRLLRPVHEGVVDVLAHHHPAHRHRAGRHPLGEGDHVGLDAIALGGERRAEAAEPGDDLVEDEQNAVFVADLAQPLQIALGRGQDPGRARHRLDDHRGDGRGVVQRDDPLERVGEMGAPFRLALGEGLMLAIIGRGKMIDAGQQRTEELAIVDHAADRNAAEADAMIGALAADQTLARALSAHVVIGERDLERRVAGLGARIAKEHMIEIARRELGQARGELERQRMGELEGRREIELRRLALDRGHDRRAVVSGVAAPQSRRAVEDRAPLGGEIMHVLGARDEPRLLLEGAIGRERQPERAQIVGNVRARGGLDGGGGVHGGDLLNGHFLARTMAAAPRFVQFSLLQSAPLS